MSSSQNNKQNTGFQLYATTSTTSYSFYYLVYYLYTQEAIFHLFYSSMCCTWWWQNWRSLSSTMYQQTHWIIHSNTQRVHVNCSFHIYSQTLAAHVLYCVHLQIYIDCNPYILSIFSMFIAIPFAQHCKMICQILSLTNSISVKVVIRPFLYIHIGNWFFNHCLAFTFHVYVLNKNHGCLLLSNVIVQFFFGVSLCIISFDGNKCLSLHEF